MNDENFRLTLIDITNKGLLNEFMNEVFNYNLNKDEYVYIQYKLVNKNIVLNIYDNKDSRNFKAYIFTNSAITSDKDTTYINVNECHDNYLTGNYDKIDILSSLLISNDKKEKERLISLLVKGKIKDIFNHYFL